MKREIISSFSGREDLIERLIQAYRNGTAAKITLLTGPSGCGKSYLVKHIASRSNKLRNTRSYINCGDSFIHPSRTANLPKPNNLSLSLTLSHIPINIQAGTQRDTTQYSQLKSLLHTIPQTTILFCIDDLSNAHSTVKSMTRILLSHWKDLERELSISIHFLLTDTGLDAFMRLASSTESIAHFELEPYTTEDILQYLKSEHLELTITKTITQNICELQKACNGNLALIDFLFVDITSQKQDYFKALDEVIRCRLEQLKKDGQCKEISEAEMEDTILSSALSLQRFTVSTISSITQRTNNSVANILDLAKEEAFVDKDFDCLYDFCCPAVKSSLEKQGVEKRKERLLYYYQYYTENEQDEYYVRAFYLIKYFGTITPPSFALLGLAYVSAILTTDSDMLAKIDSIIKKYGFTNYVTQYEGIKSFYHGLYEAPSDYDLKKLHDSYLELCNAGFDAPLRGEITRAYFHHLYSSYAPADITLDYLYNECLTFAEYQISLSDFPNPIGLTPKDETVVRLNILYSIAPYVLDIRNDVERFHKLFHTIQSLSTSCCSKSARGLAQYIENVFNRKAFLFVNEAQCGPYYDKAKSYFKKHQIWDELCLTLVCEAGTDIVIQKYDEAKNCCNNALCIAEQYGITLPEPEKLQNNLLIAEFLEAEAQAKRTNTCISKAKKTISGLKKLLHKKSRSSEYVILTNICSLSLYCGDDKGYLKYKDILQRQMSCNDISNIADDEIDDFYRYYFAWFEIYRMLRDEKWESAEQLYQNICGFVPALFQKQEVFWKLKEDALASLIKNHTVPSSYDFCNKLVRANRRANILSRFYLRGLMLSDLQYTSYN